MPETDEQLYRLMRQGSAEAFAELYTRREPAIYRYALHRSGSVSTAEDVAGEVFLQLMKPSSNFDERKGSLEGWLYGVARNLVRVARRQGPVEQPVDSPYQDDILGGLVRAENLASLHRALSDLPDRYRDVVILCDLEEKSYEDAARILGRPVGTVRSRLHRARALLSQKLKWINTPALAGTRELCA